MRESLKRRQQPRESIQDEIARRTQARQATIARPKVGRSSLAAQSALPTD